MNILIAIAIIIVIQIVKYLQQRYINALTDYGKDVVYSILAVILVGVAYLFGLIDAQNIIELLPLLFTPGGLFTFIKKIFAPILNSK